MSGLPGSSSGVAELAGRWQAWSAEVSRSAEAASRASGRLQWDGEARAACAVAWRRAVAQGDETAARMSEVAAALGDYAAALAGFEQQASSGAREEALARTAIFSSGDPWTAIGDLLSARGAVRAAAQGAERAAQVAADRIDAVLGGVRAGEGDEDGEDADKAIPGDVRDSASWDPADVEQGGIGSCYLLSSLMGLMRTDAGDALLREGLRWDEERGGYWVTLYPDGKAQEFFVDGVYGGGVTDGSRRDGVGIASVYEAAVGQYLGYADLNDGGLPADAMALVTGRDARTYTTGNTWWNPFDHEFSDDRGDIRDALGDGAAVTADTGGRDTVEDLTVTVEVGGRQQEQTVTVSGSHAYMVERIDRDGGVWVRNPWGEGNSYDGGCAFRLTPEQFAEVFGRVSVSGKP